MAPPAGAAPPPNYSRAAVDAVAHLPGVKHVEAAIPIAAAPLSPTGAPQLDNINDIEPVASVDGLFFDQDRLAVVSGRMADPARPDEVVMTPLAAQLLGVHVGERHPLRHLQPAATERSPASAPRPSRPIDASTPLWSVWCR